MKTCHTPVRLREKKLKSGGISLYLDKYVNGRRDYEFLRLYLVPERSQADREKNRQTRLLAETICTRRTLEAQGQRLGWTSEKEVANVLFYPYFEAEMRCEKSEKTRVTWRSCLKHLRQYDGRERLTLAEITTDWVRGFRRYLDTCYSFRNTKERRPCSVASRSLYWSKLKAVLHKALADDLIKRDPSLGIQGFGRQESMRMYLTIDEVKRLAATPCRRDEVRRAFLFSCLTGLRFSDVTALRWGDVQQEGEFTRIIFRQKKTGGLVYMDITPQAAQLMGEAGALANAVFPRMPDPMTVSRTLERWCKAAQIRKHITFHCARHTFATMMLELGTDLYTVSKLLGHRDISVTQIYAKVLDKAKQQAVSRIPTII